MTPSRSPRVILTDAHYSDGTAESAILAAVGATVAAGDYRTEEALLAVVGDADALLVGYTPVTRRVMEAAPRLGIVVRCGIGVDNVDLEAARERGIRVANVPDYCVDEVADHTLALLLACERQIPSLATATRDGRWPVVSDLPPMRGLRGAVLGLLGYGHIGRAVASRALAFGMRVVAYDPFLAGASVTLGSASVDLLPLEELLTEADFVSLHMPLTAETHHLIDATALRRMKPSAYLLNTARGGIIDGDAVREALTQGIIRGVGLDVLEGEPRGAREMAVLPGAIVTSHLAWYSQRSLEQLRRSSAEEIVRFLQGEPLAHPVV